MSNRPLDKWIKGTDLCNRSACQSPVNVFFFNKTMDAFYCDKCADLINRGPIDAGNEQLCVLDESKKIFEDKFKFQLSISWSEFNSASTAFTF